MRAVVLTNHRPFCLVLGFIVALSRQGGQAGQHHHPRQRGASDSTVRPVRVPVRVQVLADDRPVALGCMRLSTEPDRDENAAIAVLHAALDAGVTLLDTADAYCWTDDDRGHNERLIARALVHLAGRSILHPRRHQGRPHAPGRALGAERPRETPGRGGRRQLPRAGRGADRPLSASRTRPACPAGDERPRPCRSETPRSRRRASDSATSP